MPAMRAVRRKYANTSGSKRVLAKLVKSADPRRLKMGRAISDARGVTDLGKCARALVTHHHQPPCLIRRSIFVIAFSLALIIG